MPLVVQSPLAAAANGAASFLQSQQQNAQANAQARAEAQAQALKQAQAQQAMQIAASDLSLRQQQFAANQDQRGIDNSSAANAVLYKAKRDAVTDANTLFDQKMRSSEFDRSKFVSDRAYNQAVQQAVQKHNEFLATLKQTGDIASARNATQVYITGLQQSGENGRQQAGFAHTDAQATAGSVAGLSPAGQQYLQLLGTTNNPANPRQATGAIMSSTTLTPNDKAILIKQLGTPGGQATMTVPYKAPAVPKTPPLQDRRGADFAQGQAVIQADPSQAQTVIQRYAAKYGLKPDDASALFGQ